MLTARKLKRSQPVYRMRQTGCKRFRFLTLSFMDLEHFKYLGGLVFLMDTHLVLTLCSVRTMNNSEIHVFKCHVTQL